MRKIEENWVVLIALLAAMLLASHQLSQDAQFGLIGNYVYWVIRILAEAGIFLAVLGAVEKYLGQMLPKWGVFSAAVLLSLVPFVLTITAFDLIVGLPELGFNDGTISLVPPATAFAYELVYLLDNHVVLCVMLLLPRFMLQPTNVKSDPIAKFADEDQLNSDQSAFVTALEPPLEGDLYTVEAQEHYVHVISSDESRMVLYRFSDVVRQLPESLGMQVHRSHWVAHTAVRNTVLQGQTMKLALIDGRFVPVSRTFRAAVESRFNSQH